MAATGPPAGHILASCRPLPGLPLAAKWPLIGRILAAFNAVAISHLSDFQRISVVRRYARRRRAVSTGSVLSPTVQTSLRYTNSDMQIAIFEWIVKTSLRIVSRKSESRHPGGGPSSDKT
jgi:hypothetical protein